VIKMQDKKTFKITIEYDGTNYFGWQKQQHKRYKTIQSEIEKSLKKVLHKSVKLTGSGRTDKGVHAINQVASFESTTNLCPKPLTSALNSYLNDDIRIKDIRITKTNFHARFSAKSKTYRYLILNQEKPSVFLRHYAWHIKEKLDLELMKKTKKYLLGTKNFKAFVNEPKGINSFTRELIDISISKSRNIVTIDITSTGFLRGMVRNLVKLITDVGLKKISLSEINKITKTENRSLIGKSAPAQGLYLYQVKY